jgi:hypothetical protein
LTFWQLLQDVLKNTHTHTHTHTESSAWFNEIWNGSSIRNSFPNGVLKMEFPSCLSLLYWTRKGVLNMELPSSLPLLHWTRKCVLNMQFPSLFFSCTKQEEMCIEYGVSFSLSFSLSLWHWTRNKIVKITASQSARVKHNTREHVTCSHTAAYTQRVTDAGNYATGTSECTNLAVLIKSNFQTQKSIHSFRSLALNSRSPYNNNNKTGAAAGPFSSRQLQQPATPSLQLRLVHTLLCSRSSSSSRLLQSTGFEHATTEVLGTSHFGTSFGHVWGLIKFEDWVAVSRCEKIAS